jgi:DNA-binding IclR family transcriptional regulator
LESARLRQYLKSTPRQRFTPSTVTSARSLAAELLRIREDGIARTRDERVMGASGVAAPIFSSTGAVVAALLIAGPSDRMRANAERNERLVREAAAECTHLAGSEPHSTS